MSDVWTIVLPCLAYLIASPFVVWWVQSRYKGTLLAKTAAFVTAPAGLVLLLCAAPLSIPYFWLYPERHKTTIDSGGTPEEKQALADYRAALKQESLWNRILFRSGIRDASDNRLRADEAIDRVWQHYNDRTKGRMEEEC